MGSMKTVYIAMVLLLLTATTIGGQDKPRGRPLAKVLLSDVQMGKVAPQSEFIGTVFYQEVSDVASEMSGIVENVAIEDGQRVKKRQILVKLVSDLLRKRIQAIIASYEQNLADLENARMDYQRMEKLFRGKTIAKQRYDENRFRVMGLEKRAAALKADVERLELELKKKTIRAPFDGVVIERHADRGEWLAAGSAVATLAKDDVVDIVAEIPEKVLQYVKKDSQVKIRVAGKELIGSVFAIVPRGDIATRTFPVKIRTPNTLSLIEGMEARVSLPTGKKRNAHMVPRDAVISSFGRLVVFTVNGSKARMIPIQVIGYEGLTIGVEAEGLENGMKVVVKGNERIRDGQEIAVINSVE
jgi:RND family efflux transporter MFP subunit